MRCCDGCDTEMGGSVNAVWQRRWTAAGDSPMPAIWCCRFPSPCAAVRTADADDLFSASAIGCINLGCSLVSSPCTYNSPGLAALSHRSARHLPGESYQLGQVSAISSESSPQDTKNPGGSTPMT